MAIRIQQFNGDELVDYRDYVVPGGQSDEAFIAIKAASAQRAGWHVERNGNRVTATKTRWGGILCTRIYEVR